MDDRNAPQLPRRTRIFRGHTERVGAHHLADEPPKVRENVETRAPRPGPTGYEAIWNHGCPLPQQEPSVPVDPFALCTQRIAD